MSEAVAEKSSKAPAAAGGGNKKLLLIVVVVNVLLLGGGAYYVISSKNHAAEEAAKAAKAAHKAKPKAEEGEEGEAAGGEEEEEEEAEEPSKDAHAKSKFGPLLEVGTFVANLTASAPGQPPRYAKVTLHVEALNEEAKVRVEGGLVPIKSEALLVLSNAKPEDVIGQDKILALAAELLKRCNKLLGKKSIKRVYFSELVVQ